MFHLAPGALARVEPGEELVLDGPEGHHAARVRRVTVGEVVLLADGSGVLARAVAEQVGVGVVRLRVTSLAVGEGAGPGTPQGQPRLVLVQALAKGGRDEMAVAMATELGVDEVVAWQADRCVVVWRGERTARSLAKWRSVATAAAKQSRRATVPEVTGPLGSLPLAGRIRDCAAALVLHEGAATALTAAALPATGEVLVVVGPEGGITPDELGSFAAAGAQSVRLGPTVLRSSTAGPAALAVLAAQLRWR